ncbi:MAG: alanine--tRNA ligase [Candidatus Riflebacteria bacterium]|nr:alanine--tRNA ligase [Candidatus Riflebacteria bacterium]
MNTAQIRQKFLDFFAGHDHVVKSSYPIIPQDDPTLLFISAGMAPFKPYFLGLKTDLSRAASCQKCFRTTDIENVGYTARHHTFFEMLGNFSFGDYFKQDAIAWAWEFITKELGIPKDKLHVSIHHSDDEAGEIWHTKIGIPSDRIVKLGDKDNFWTIGVGPSGPCSEIYIDQGPELSCGKPDCGVGCDCARYLEFWNLVFTQYNRSEDGTLTPLEKKNIDTGMGLERLAAIMQGKKDNFANDIFSTIMGRAEQMTEHRFGESQQVTTALKVVSDHIRALSFAIADGAMPGNEGRGYVLRKILRRAARFGYRYLGREKPFLFSLVPTVAEAMSFYTEVGKNAEHVMKVIQGEEERFLVTLKTGTDMLNGYISELKKTGQAELDGGKAFLLHDTFGFPLDLTREMCREEGIAVDQKGFDTEIGKQRERGRANVVSAFMNLGAVNPSDYPATRFLGYDTLTADGKILAVLNQKDTTLVIADQTPFYATSGGQQGDVGVITSGDVTFEVISTEKVENVFLHNGQFKNGHFTPGVSAHFVVNETARRSTMRNHTATHILHKALQETLGNHVKQAGSHVAPDYLRLDFNHYESISGDLLKKIEKRVNENVLAALPVTTVETNYNDAVKRGAMALFGEKYGDIVRLVEVGGYSKELCGGTHIKNSAEIGPFALIAESSIASGVRRIEAVTGAAAWQYLTTLRTDVAKLSELLGCDSKSICEKTSRLIAEVKTLQNELETFRKKDLLSRVDAIKGKARLIGSVTAILSRVDGLSVDEMKNLADEIVGNHPNTLTVLTAGGEKPAFVVKVSKDLTKKGFHAGNLVKEIAKVAGGSGGGRPELATAGAKDASRLDEAVLHAEKLISNLAGSASVG